MHICGKMLIDTVLRYQHVESCAEWPPFSMRHIYCIFLNANYFDFWNFKQSISNVHHDHQKKMALRRYNESNTILFIYFVHYMPSKLIQNVYMILLYFEFRLVVVVLSFSVEVWDPFPYVMEDLLTLRHSYVRAWVLLRRNIYVIIFFGWWLVAKAIVFIIADL